MRVEQWMTAYPLTVKPCDSVAQARALLREHRINQLPVAVNGRLAGIVTDRDLRDVMSGRAADAKASGDKLKETDPPEDLPIEAVMTANVITVQPYDTMERATVLMRRERIGSLPVVYRGELRGIVTRTDVLRAYLALASYSRKAGINDPRQGSHLKPEASHYAHR